MTIAYRKAPTDLQRAAPDTVERIVALAHGWSIEATLPTDAEVAALAAILPAGSRVYLSAVPTRDPATQFAAAERLHAAGFAPVPHVAVRTFATDASLDAFLARMVGEAGVRRVLVIAGDRDRPAGAFRSAIEAIDSGVLQRHGIAEIDIAGYPAGHPFLSPQELDRALTEKVDIAAELGLAVGIVTQFCFDPDPIIAWIRRLRDFGVENCVRIGLAGPTNIAALLRFARRCGVEASAQGLVRQSGLARHIFGMSAPDALVRVLAGHAAGEMGDVALHFFSFGGIAATARWAKAVAEGRITLDAASGFRVAPPRPGGELD
jgi:methylenetetrahydrofolate reductase (NADPH)